MSSAFFLGVTSSQFIQLAQNSKKDERSMIDFFSSSLSKEDMIKAIHEAQRNNPDKGDEDKKVFE